MHTITIDGDLWLRCGDLTTIKTVLAAHREGRQAHLPIVVSLYDGLSTYIVPGGERREDRALALVTA